MLTRVLAALLGLFYAANGLAMLAAPASWFAAAPGATDTGPFNLHFVADVGLAFLAGAVSFLAYAWRPQLKLVALGGSGFLVLHACLHLWSIVVGEVHHPATDLAVIVVPAFLGLAIVWPHQGDLRAPLPRQPRA